MVPFDLELERINTHKRMGSENDTNMGRIRV